MVYAFQNYWRQTFPRVWAKLHPDQAKPEPQKSSSAAAASSSIAILDKLCSAVTGEELFKKDYAKTIYEKKENLRSERLQYGGTTNSAALYQEARKDVWASLPVETKDEFNKKAKELNSNVLR